MENDAKKDPSFAAIKERWKQNASKFGSPLPKSAAAATAAEQAETEVGTLTPRRKWKSSGGMTSPSKTTQHEREMVSEEPKNSMATMSEIRKKFEQHRSRTPATFAISPNSTRGIRQEPLDDDEDGSCFEMDDGSSTVAAIEEAVVVMENNIHLSPSAHIASEFDVSEYDVRPRVEVDDDDSDDLSESRVTSSTVNSKDPVCLSELLLAGTSAAGLAKNPMSGSTGAATLDATSNHEKGKRNKKDKHTLLLESLSSHSSPTRANRRKMKEEYTTTPKSDGRGRRGIILTNSAGRGSTSSDEESAPKPRRRASMHNDRSSYGEDEQLALKKIISPLFPMKPPAPPITTELARKPRARVKSSIKRRQAKQAVIYRKIETSNKDLPKNSHSDYEEDAILQALYNRNELFSSLAVYELGQLVAAFESGTISYDAGDFITSQGDTDAEYFYVMERGMAEITVNDEHVGMARKGDSFGELALLYHTPQAATVLALEDCEVYRVHESSFRAVLSAETERCINKKNRLLQGIHFLEHFPTDKVKLMSEAMTPQCVEAGKVLVEIGTVGTSFYIIAEGQVQSTSANADNQKNRNVMLKAGDYFGEQSLVTGKPILESYHAMTDCLFFAVGKDVFEHIFADFRDYILKDQDVRKLVRIPFIMNKASRAQTVALACLMKDKKFKAGEVIFKEREATKAALYLVREGTVQARDNNEIGAGGYFGDGVMQKADSKSKRSTKPLHTVTAKTNVVCAVLSLKDFWSICDPDKLNSDKKPTSSPPTSASNIIAVAETLPPAPPVNVPLKDLSKKAILGEGTFGQVWLVADPQNQTYALKIQSKAFLVGENQVEAVIQEKIMLNKMKHPFLINLFRTYQDKYYIYMLLEFVQGGELFSLMHEVEDRDSPLPEDQARFYAFCLADVLAYLHRGKYLYRDCKPENCMIDSQGYLKLIDFGFCKYLLAEKTYTLVGTPGYLSPELVTSVGHNWGVDHWALGILIYEMVSGSSPFYYEDIDQMELFQSIVNDKVTPPSSLSLDCADIIVRLLHKDPASRLGAARDTEVLEHPWFSRMNLQMLRSRLWPAPWTPDLDGPLDRSFFNDWSELEGDGLHGAYQNDSSKKGQVLSARDAKLFEGVF
jgi:CRP-like cAMP-binding protein